MKLMLKTLSWGYHSIRFSSVLFRYVMRFIWLILNTCWHNVLILPDYVLINSTFFQICRFCWNKIRTEGSGLCPACRSPYAENPADFKPLTAEELAKIKEEKRKKDQVRGKHKEVDNLGVQKHLMFSSNWIYQCVMSSNMKCLKSENLLTGDFLFSETC